MMMMINIILISVMARPFHRRRRGHCPSRQQALRELERLRPDQCEHDHDDDDDDEEDDDDDEEEEDDDDDDAEEEEVVGGVEEDAAEDEAA